MNRCQECKKAASPSESSKVIRKDAGPPYLLCPRCSTPEILAKWRAYDFVHDIELAKVSAKAKPKAKAKRP